MSDGASDGVSSFGPEGKREAGARPARSRHGNELRYDMQGVVKVSLTRSMESTDTDICLRFVVSRLGRRQHRSESGNLPAVGTEALELQTTRPWSYHTAVSYAARYAAFF